MSDHRFEPRSTPAPAPAAPPADDDYHCPNCLYLGDPGEGFWACQNLCIRE